MSKFILKRIIQLILIMFVISFLTFSLSYFLTSDPVTIQYESMGMQGNKEVIEEIKENLGLNDSFGVRYIRWLSNVLSGDFGYSIRYDMPVKEKLIKSIPQTFNLTLMSIFMTIIVALPLGVMSAIYQNKFIDYIIRFFSFVGVSIPSFWLGMLLIYYFAVKFKILPSSGMGTMKHVLLPTITLSAWYSALYIRRIRTSILEEMNKNYIKGLLAKGIGNFRILTKHIIPNSLLPIVTSFGMSIGGMLGGTIVIESIFEWQGVGTVAIDAIKNRDYALIQGYVLWLSFIFVVINLAVDISYQSMNPKVRINR